MDLSYDQTKFTEMVILTAHRLLDDRAGGATKLNKVLFFAEFTHFRRHGQVISGCEFQKLEHGPAPRELVPVRSRLIDAGEATLVAEDFLGRVQHRLVPLRDPDLAVFSADELDTITDVLHQLEGYTARQVSDLSHEEPGWQLTELGEVIPYATAFLGSPQPATPTGRQLAADVARRYGFVDAG